MTTLEFAQIEHEKLRKQLWADAWRAQSATNASDADRRSYADRALIEFDKKFPKPQN